MLMLIGRRPCRRGAYRTFRSGPVPALFLALILFGAGLSGPASAQQAQEGQGTASRGEPDFDPLPPPSLNFYGSPGIVDMPTAEMLPDGQFVTNLSYFGGQTRFTMTFQATPWMSASFRYNAIRNWNLFGFPTYYDRGFDVRFRLFRERRRWPEITLGLQDFAGTGIYSAEYVVATKRFAVPARGASRGPGQIKLTAGLGWGRLGTYGAIGGSGTRPAFDGSTSSGGSLGYDQWFRGPFAPFAGIEWQANDRLGFKLEYSSDAYVTETQTTSVFERKSPINFGVEYQATPRTRLGAYYLYGSEFGVNAQIQINPNHPTRRMVIAGPQPIQPRPDRAAHPELWATGWADSQSAAPTLIDALVPLLEQEGLILESLDVSADSAELRFRDLRYTSRVNGLGRAARAMARVMPASVETFRLVPVSNGMGLSTITIRRSDLEALEFDPDNTGALLAVTGISEAGTAAATARTDPDQFPETGWGIAPYFLPAYFDPQQPIRIDVGVDFDAFYRPAPNWVIAGKLRQRIAGNTKEGRGTSSNLPPVRTDQVLYLQYDTTLNNLYVARYWQPGADLYARATAGYFEYGYGGVSTELLWKPVSSQLGLGLELNYAIKRDFDQRLGFQDYRVFTGHASAYMDFNNGFHAQIDAGRYLAGDIGATFSLDRVFNNGWAVGGFFTLTNVSSEDFGEGSFDKGIRFRIPLGWFTGRPSQNAIGTTIRPIQRDGGARVYVPGRLYGQIRNAHKKALKDQWVGFWE